MSRQRRSGFFAAVLMISSGLANLSLSAIAVAGPPTVTAETYRVGAAKIDITPDYPVRLSGFGFRREESAGIESRIFARALAISTAEGAPAVLLAVDSTGISQAIVDQVGARLQADGVRRERLVITATHTHTAPMLSGVLETLFGEPIPPDHQSHIDRYTTDLTDQLVSVARSALQDRKPAELWWGIGQVNFAKNRRNPKEGPVDHSLPVLAVKSPEGDLQAVLATYACHAVTLSHNLIGGDWPGKAAEGIERRHPQAIALISIGCGADQNPLSGVTGDKTDVAVAQGLQLASEVDRVLHNAMRPLHGAVEAERKRFPLPLVELPPRAFWEQRAQEQGYIGHHARVQLETLDRGETLPTAVDYSVQTWNFGDSLAMVFLPGEVVVDYALRLRKEFDPSRLWVTAYANDTPCYIPSERVLAEGGYEGANAMTYYNKPAKLASGLQQKIVDATVDLLPETFLRSGDATDAAGLPPLSPTQSLGRLTIPDDWSAQVVAAEPLTTDPVAIDFAPDGALWVCEMHDYPSGLAGNFEPGGKVRLLRDDDGDGIYDRSTVFLDRLPFPTGVTVWRKGVLICAAPDILYAEDTDGDDRADIQRVLFSGFGTENYQARVNSLTFGLDGWIYGACGLFGGEIQSQLTGETVALGNRDFRIDPDRGILEPLTGRSQQGRVRNDTDDWFGCTNGQPCLHYPILQDQTRAGLPLPPLVISVPTADARQVFPAIADYQRFKLSGPAGQVTAACGLGIYRDNWLGHDLSGNAVVCEPVNLLIHRRVLVPSGLTFEGRRAADEATSELITSTDHWFRPVQVRTGPDGGLWIADMSRSVIEHPRWIPPETLAKLDVRAGDDQGRIIRILPKGRQGRPVPNLAAQSAIQWVEALKSDNGTVRDLAQQMLMWNADPDAVPALRTLVRSQANASGRAAGMWVLAKYGAISEAELKVALQSPDPVLRRQAARVLAEQGEQLSDFAKLLTLLTDEENPFVLRELIHAIEVHRAPEGFLTILSDLYRRYHGQTHLRFLILRAVHSDDWSEFVKRVLDGADDDASLLAPLLAISLADRDRQSLRPLLDRILAQPVSSVSLQLAEQVSEKMWQDRDLENPWWDAASLSELRELQQQARAILQEGGASTARRIAAAGMLGLDPQAMGSDLELLVSQLTPRSPAALQQRAIAVLARTWAPQVPDQLLNRLAHVGPAANQQIIAFLLRRPATAKQLLAAIQSGSVPSAYLSTADRQALLQHPDEELRLLAQRVLAQASRGSRKQVIESYRSALALSGDPQRGLAIYQKHCRTCHRYADEGFDVGPSLTESRNKSWSALLISLLDPNQAVDQRYCVYVVATTDGRVLQGLLAQEGEDSITITGPDAKQTVIPRDEIEVLKKSDRSMMPEGLEEVLSRQDVADLFALITERTESGPADAATVAERAAQLLDDTRPTEERQKLLQESLDRPAELIAAMITGLPAGDLVEAYRRIPWIWRVAIAAARRDNSEELVALLDVSLPQPGEPLQDWQAVVLGGGLINGISQNGDWPHERIATLIGNDRELRARWRHALDQAVAMSDDESIKPGTRYDALRMIAMRGWNGSGDQLVRYLKDASSAELQMGAVSGLVDVPDPPATAALLAGLPQLTERNRELALAGILRSQDRSIALLQSIRAGEIPRRLIDQDVRRRLLKSDAKPIRELASQTFASQ